MQPNRIVCQEDQISWILAHGDKLQSISKKCQSNFSYCPPKESQTAMQLHRLHQLYEKSHPKTCTTFRAFYMINTESIWLPVDVRAAWCLSKINAAVLESIMLTYLNINKMFIIYMDASDDAIGRGWLHLLFLKKSHPSSAEICHDGQRTSCSWQNAQVSSQHHLWMQSHCENRSQKIISLWYKAHRLASLISTSLDWSSIWSQTWIQWRVEYQSQWTIKTPFQWQLQA